ALNHMNKFLILVAKRGIRLPQDREQYASYAQGIGLKIKIYFSEMVLNMSLSIFLARVLGLYLIITGFFYLFRRGLAKKVTKDYFENASLVMMGSIINLIIGLMIAVGHNIWEWNWTLVITLIGYLSLLKGLTLLFIPSHAERKFMLKFVAKENPIYIGIVWLIIGFFLTYEGFFSV
ncbi:MAG: hypothetical protein JJU12_05150, partial [Chlamydiales bacterium]|nr:hypothetical protein [Chlamydiales bacterium]